MYSIPAWMPITTASTGISITSPREIPQHPVVIPALLINASSCTQIKVAKCIERLDAIQADLCPGPAAATGEMYPWELSSDGFSSIGNSEDVAADEVRQVKGMSSRILDDDRELVRGRVSGRPTSDIKPSLSSWNVTSITPSYTATTAPIITNESTNSVIVIQQQRHLSSQTNQPTVL